MKHTLLYIGLALASFMMQPAAVQAKAKKEAKVVKQLVVLHTNDTHSCVMPINPNLADTATANRGGFLRRVAMISQERKANPDICQFGTSEIIVGADDRKLRHLKDAHHVVDAEIELMVADGSSIIFHLVHQSYFHISLEERVIR